MWKKKSTWNSSLKNQRGTRVSETRVPSLRITVQLGFFIFLSFFFFFIFNQFFFYWASSSFWRKDFQSIRAMTSQVQTESVHNFIIKVGFFFFEMLFFLFFSLFFGFWKKFHMGLWCSGFLLLCSTRFLLGISSLFCWISSPSSFFLSTLWNLSLTNLIST